MTGCQPGEARTCDDVVILWIQKAALTELYSSPITAPPGDRSSAPVLSCPLSLHSSLDLILYGIKELT